MTETIFAEIQQKTGVARKEVLRYRTLRGAPIGTARDFLNWYDWKLADDKFKVHEYNARNKERLKVSSRKSYLLHREKVLLRCKLRVRTEAQRQMARASAKRWRENNLGKRKAYLDSRKEIDTEYQKKWARKYPEKRRAYRKRSDAKHKARRVEAGKAYRAKNIEKVRAWRRKHLAKKNTQPAFIIERRLRGRLNDELRFRARKTHKFTSAKNLIGCTRAQLAVYIEAQFKPGMSWQNRSEWHIDHIRPVSSFDMMDLEEQKKCFHFSNLRPLWRSENCSKGSKIIEFEAA